MAWAQHRGIPGCRYRSTTASGRTPRWARTAGIDYWRQWYLALGRAGAGQHTLAVRALDENGEPQSAARATVFPDGASGVQSIVVNVA